MKFKTRFRIVLGPYLVWTAPGVDAGYNKHRPDEDGARLACDDGLQKALRLTLGRSCLKEEAYVTISGRSKPGFMKVQRAKGDRYRLIVDGQIVESTPVRNDGIAKLVELAGFKGKMAVWIKVTPA